MDKRTISVVEMARVLGISRPKAYELANRADFPALHIGRRILVPVAAFDQWLQNQVTPPLHAIGQAQNKR